MENDAAASSKQILIVTGLSGAGKNVVIRALEDLGFYCVDNLPIPLISTFLTFAAHTQTNLIKVALVIDARGEQFLDSFMRELDSIHKEASKKKDHIVKLIFLKASSQTLLKRFEETRRRHPLAKENSLLAAIEKEIELLSPLSKRADIILDTDTFNIHELRQWVRNSFAQKNKHHITLNLISFGFKYGIPPESNLLFDVRFLPNPYFIPALKELTGKEEAIQNFLFNQSLFNDYWERFSSFLTYSVQKYFDEGRPFVTIAIGCTGGKHRSVSIVERLQKESWEHVTCISHHRDIERG